MKDGIKFRRGCNNGLTSCPTEAGVGCKINSAGLPPSRPLALTLSRPLPGARCQFSELAASYLLISGFMVSVFKNCMRFE